MSKDEIREKILSVLNEKHDKARGRDSELVGIRELAQGVKKYIPEVKESDVASNTSFLIRNEYIEEVPVENYYSKAKFGNTKPSYKYRLTRDGLAYFESDSKFDRGNVFAGIGDITGHGNTIVIGNANNVTSLANNQFQEGHKLAEDLRRRVNALGELSDEEKISIQGDLETIKSQLSKKDPDKAVLKSAKQNLSFLADIAAVAPYAQQLFDWIGKVT